MGIKKIGVIGAGIMGSGIAHVCAVAGFEVLFYDLKQEYLDRGIERIQKGLQYGIEKGKITPDQKNEALKRICRIESLDSMSDAQYIIEAISEDETQKKVVFQHIDALCSNEVIFASNTSSLSITKLASFTRRSQRFIGMHFFNPVPAMKLVEIIRGLDTSDETVAITQRLSEQVGKQSVLIANMPGFAVNRIMLPMINEAIFCIMEGVGTKEAIDTAMKLGANHPMGPLELADLIGLDVCLSILEIIFTQTGDPKYRPCILLRSMVDAGYLGKKTKRGFYLY